MLLSELEYIVLAETGQYITGSMKCIGINRELFYKGLVKKSLSLYERYRPDVYTFNRYAVPTGNAQASIKFVEEVDSLKAIVDERSLLVANVGPHSKDPLRIPTQIYSCVPVNVVSTAGVLYLINETRFRQLAEQTVLHEPRTFLYQYEAPWLYVSEIGMMDITAGYPYVRVEMYAAQEPHALVDVDLHHIEEGKDDIFLDLVIAQFLMMVGRSRRVFMIDGQPVTYDASEMVSEGKELYDEARNRLYEQSNWWLSFPV